MSLLMLNVKLGKAVNINVQVIGLTRLTDKNPKSAATESETGALSTLPSKQLNQMKIYLMKASHFLRTS